MNYLITTKSKNKKVGPIMVTTSERATCPNACPFKGNGCYADGGPLRFLWDKLSIADGATSFKNGKGTVQVHNHAQLLEAIEAQPEGALWRHNQAGDLPGEGDKIDDKALTDIVRANKGRNGFTYTHKPLTRDNREGIAFANKQGFTVNLSANSLSHADELAALDIGPVVTVLPIEQLENTTTPAGRKVVVCPAVTGKTASCATCALCQKRDRNTIVGFPAHGVGKNKAQAVTQS
jgi:hypothetical protein|tara:strand:- start:3973 stop:4677 length:705 start_codon:yes stop_codon:yes gene_type:complete